MPLGKGRVVAIVREEQKHHSMGAAYTILGKNVPSHYLAIGTLTAVIGGVKLNSLLGGSGDAEATPAPAAAAPAAAASGELDVEKAINDFLASSDKKDA